MSEHVQAMRRYKRAQALADARRVEMLEALRDAREEGATLQELADDLDISRGRVHQLLKGL